MRSQVAAGSKTNSSALIIRTELYPRIGWLTIQISPRGCARPQREYFLYMKPLKARMRAGLTSLALLALALTGCATYKIDWSPRVGNYTYDQAVLELGPPGKYSNLKDGTPVAEWV